MHSSIPIRQESPRIEVRSEGLDTPESTLTSVQRVAQQLLRNVGGEVGLAVVHIARHAHGIHHCDTQLFGRGLEHVAGYAEHTNPVEAATHSVTRALRALDTSERHNPWTSSHPSCHRGEVRAK